MSLQQTREDLALAIGTVEGLTGYKHRPSTAKPGDAWVRWRGAERQNGAAYFQRWSIVVMLPQQTETAADEFLETRAAELGYALGPFLFVQEITPADLGTGDATVYALMITGRTE